MQKIDEVMISRMLQDRIKWMDDSMRILGTLDASMLMGVTKIPDFISDLEDMNRYRGAKKDGQRVDDFKRHARGKKTIDQVLVAFKKETRALPQSDLKTAHRFLKDYVKEHCKRSQSPLPASIQTIFKRVKMLEALCKGLQ